LVGIGG
jgi:hypothetical protein